MSLVNITKVSGQPIINLKWRANADTGSTWLGPLAADLNNDGDMEIVITGLSGKTAALDPESGNIIWSVPYGGDHVPIEIVDLNKDGALEILMCPQYINGTTGHGVLALHGNNGSVYWYNSNAAGKGTYIGIADINADGYPEIFTATSGGVTALTYDGNIFASTWTYYSCYGGMSAGDTDFDGVFEVYLGERSDSYPSYPSGGRGLRAFWPGNLTERWAHPDILCSSQAPAMADVDKDGDLEIIILNQRGGIAVINTDGSVNTYKGIYRKQLTISGLPNGHDNPTIADLDGDGNLELITCSNANHDPTQPKIWDLVNWKLDATLPFPCMHPPGLADLDGDGKWEILDCNKQNVTIFKYNSNTNNYDIIGTINLPMVHSFFIAQDIDADGKLEIVFNQHNSWVSVYDVEAPAPPPLPRSGESFYSQYRTRVPEYVPPSDQSPRITEFSPADGAINVPVSLSELSFKLIDYQNELMTYTVTTSPNIGSANGVNVPNGRITVPVGGLTSSTTYTCTVTATDGQYTTKRTFIFYTEGTVSLAISATPIGTGSVIKNPDKTTYVYGERVQLTAVATDPLVYKFSKWRGALAWMGSNNPAIIIMDGDKIVTAEFTKIQYTLTIYTTGSGSVTRNNTGPYYYGDAVELTAVPNAGWSFSHWERDLTGKQNPATIIINSAKSVTAVFVEEPPVEYVLSVSVVGSGSVSKVPDQPAYSA
ncbi:MAG: FG-GAP-like repeat-containing protein, partial [Candidatus Bathyarchaeia archaeon]